MKISIIIAYYNRRKLFLNTLYSITKTKYKGDLEIIIVDDASTDSHKLRDFPTMFPSLNIKLVEVNPTKKWWINPCIPYNIGFSLAEGEKIIIQNPECLHMFDIINYTENNLKLNDYLAFGSYAIGPQKTAQINRLDNTNTIVEDVRSIIMPMNNVHITKCPWKERWYNHSVFNPGAINFCCGIMKKDLNDLGGFDETFAKGIAKDDREFVVRVKKKGMNIIYVDDLFVVHQCHGYTNYSNKKLVDKNNKLFQETVDRDTYKVKNETLVLEEVVL